MVRAGKKFSLPGGAATGGRKPNTRHSSANLLRTSLIDPGTLSDSGGGSSGQGSGATPTNLANTTPPTSPSRGGMVSIGGESDLHHFGFSPKTCLDLLPHLTVDQLKFEIKYLNITTTASSKQGYINALTSELRKYIDDDFVKTIDSVSNTISSFACLVRRAEDVVDKLCEIRESPPVAVPDEQSEELVSDLPVPELPELDHSVCRLYDDIFKDLSVTGILAQISCNKAESHGRKTAYFGNTCYTYGRVTHEPAPYPSCALFETLLEGMKALVPEFSYDNYTCLVTHYPDGKSQIPLHCDDEQQIVENSVIYTVSVGANRHLTLQNQVGLLNEATVEVKHGSVYSMSRESQSTWKHGMLPQDGAEPRISFGFRQLRPRSTITKRPPAPPVTHPDNYRSPNAVPAGTHDRCLLLTDSILSATSVSIFNRVQNLRCIKKENKRLVDIFNFEPEFSICNTVIISAGVNDLSCYGLRANALADMVCERLRRTCHMHPRTKFIFNSVLNVHNKYDWLNHEINLFNSHMYELSQKIPNMAFFDSHAVLMRDRISESMGGVIDMREHRGVHITWEAKKLITDHLVNALDLTWHLTSGKPVSGRLKNWSWPVRHEFADSWQVY